MSFSPMDFIVAGLLVFLVFSYVVPLVRRVMRGRANYLPPLELSKMMKEGDDVLVIDIRSEKEYRGRLGHIPGSCNVPFASLCTRLPELTEKVEAFKDIPIVIVSRKDAGSGFLSYKLLLDRGFKNVSILDNGMIAWLRAGLETIREKTI